MTNYLNLLQSPQINHIAYFEVIRDFRKGGLSPDNYDEFMKTVEALPSLSERTPDDYKVFDTFNLKDVSPEDFQAIYRELSKRAINSSKKCWHPEASKENCDTDASGKIKVTAAHSIQNNGILSRIVKNGHVMSYVLEKGEFDGEEKGKNLASIFFGFCNTHDSIFAPIETEEYKQIEEQNFLFAYRGLVVSSHKKIETSSFMNYGEQSENDLEENKKIFDQAIQDKEYGIIETEVFELPNFYPIAASSSFYLEFDFEGNPIKHSDERMEDIHVTFFPAENKSYFLLSYFKEDSHLYGNLGEQLRKRDSLKSDITMLIAAHTENVYFEPDYYKTFIEQYEETLELIMFHSQFDYAFFDNDGNITGTISMTPSHYLDNPYGINFFGY